MPFLSSEEHSRLLTQLLRAPGLSFGEAAEAFRATFPPQDRLRACCAAGTLLEVRAALHRQGKRALQRPMQPPKVQTLSILLVWPVQQSKALTTAQRLGAWFLLHDSWAGGTVPAQHPLVHLFVRTVHDDTRLPVERNLVLQLLQGHGLEEVRPCHCCATVHELGLLLMA